MRHLVEGRKLGRTSSHRKALLCNLATSLFQYKRILTTEAKAKELRPFAERLITKAKNALVREKLGSLPDGQKVDIHNRRIVYKHIRNKAVLQELFDTIAPQVENRQGGYTRIVKVGFRRGDAGRTAIIELVDWSNPVDGTIDLQSRKKALAQSKAKRKAKKSKVAKEGQKVTKEEEITDVAKEEVQTAATVIETPADTPEKIEVQDVVTEETATEEIKAESTEVTESQDESITSEQSDTENSENKDEQKEL